MHANLDIENIAICKKTERFFSCASTALRFAIAVHPLLSGYFVFINKVRCAQYTLSDS